MTRVYTHFRLLRRLIRSRSLKFFRREDQPIIPFEEKPAQDTGRKVGQPNIAASDLFSIFTADIMGANKVFVR